MSALLNQITTGTGLAVCRATGARLRLGLLLAALLLALGVGDSARAAVFFSETNGNWGSAGTWSSTTNFPTAADEAHANHPITVETNHFCGYLHLNNALSIAGGRSLTIYGGASGEAAAGSIQSGGTLDNRGTFDFKVGPMTVGGNARWNNVGQFLHSSVGDLTLSGTWWGMVFENSGGTYEFRTDAGITGGGLFRNTGLLRKAGGSGTTVINCGQFHNFGGTIDVLSGRLELACGGGDSYIPYLGSSNGTINVVGGSVLDGVLPKSLSLSNKCRRSSLSGQPGATLP